LSDTICLKHCACTVIGQLEKKDVCKCVTCIGRYPDTCDFVKTYNEKHKDLLLDKCSKCSCYNGR